jgi:hypothetical protein
MNKSWIGLALICGLLFLGCPNTVSENWTRITNFTEITGTWEGSTTVPIPPMPTEQLPASSIDCALTITVSSDNFTETINMDMNTYLTDIAGVMGKPIAWQLIKNTFEGYEAPEGMALEFTDAYHVIQTATIDVSQMQFTDETIAYAPYINEDKTKIKLVLPEDITSILGEKPIEFILYKK